MSRLKSVIYFGAFSLFACAVVAEEQFPETISLQYALQRAESNHPDIEQAQAAIELAESERLEAESLTGTNISIRSRLRYVEPNNNILNQTHNDSSIGLYVSKNIYDFGRSEAASRAANSAIKGERISLASARNQRRLDIMRRYFDVVLADLEYLRDNEDMSTAFIALSRGQDRRELGQLSDVDILELDNNYQQVRLKRYRSDNQQRSTRSLLAIAMNQVGELPATLENPTLPSLSRKIPELEEIQLLAKKSNPALRVAQARLSAASARVESARASNSPILSGEFEVSESQRAIGSTDDARIGLHLNIPLFAGGKTKARTAKQQAVKRSEKANLARQHAYVEQTVLELWLELNNLVAQRQQAIAQLDYSELYLDQRRALYELETKTNLGNAMVQISEAQRYLKETEFDMAYRWAQLDALMGKTVYVQAAGEKQ
ncbi:MAG: TolC family protein [Sulfuriflexus sp.]|nr:TolC family protein [Sulfuriflexus sp.]